MKRKNSASTDVIFNNKIKTFTDVTTVNKDGVLEIPFSGLKPKDPPGLFPSNGQAQDTHDQIPPTSIESNTGKRIKKAK